MRISDWSSDVCSSDLNTPAGIVKFDTVKPGKTGGHARVSYGRYGTSQVEVAAGAAYDSGFSVRLSGLYQHRDDWVDNIATTKKDDLAGSDDIPARHPLQYESGPFTRSDVRPFWKEDVLTCKTWLSPEHSTQKNYQT